MENKRVLTDLNVKELSGRNGLIIFFYPKAGSSVCSLEAQQFNKYLPDFEKIGFNIVGVSKDNPKMNDKFSCDKDLKYPLISDENLLEINKFNVWKQKSMFGKKYMGVERSTFVVDKDGKEIIEMRKVKAVDHVQKLLSELEEKYK